MKSRPVPPPLGTATLQKSSDAQGNLVKPVLGFRRGKKELLENEQSRQNVVLDQGRYGEFIFKVRKLITEPSPTNPKTQLKKNKDRARQELRMYLRNLAPEGEELETDTLAFEDHFEGLNLSLELELDAIYKSETTDHGKDAAVRMALTHGNGSSWSVVKILEKRENTTYFKHCIDFLGGLSDETLSYFITRSVVNSTPSESADLAKSLLDITSGEHVVETLKKTINMLLEDRETPKEARVDLLYRAQTLLLSVMNRFSPPDINLGDIIASYKQADSSNLRNRAAKLLLTHFKENAPVIFWNIANDNDGVTGRDIAYCSPQKFAKLRERRLDALRCYVNLARKEAVSNLKEFVLREQDPLLVQEACDLLLNTSICGTAGSGALLEAIDKDIKDNEPSLALACLFSLHRYREPVLRKLLSSDLNVQEAFLKLEGLYLSMHNAASDEVNLEVDTQELRDFISQIGLQNIVSWMNSSNKKLRENAINIFQHASDKCIEVFMSSRHHEATLLRQMADVAGGKRVIGQKASKVHMLDPNKHGKLIQRIRDLAPPIEAKKDKEELEALQNQARVDLKDTVAELVKNNDVGLSLQVELMADILGEADLCFGDELMKLYNNPDVGTETTLIKMLLEPGYVSAEFVINQLEDNAESIDKVFCIKALKTLTETELQRFVNDSLLHENDGMDKMSNLTSSLLEVTNGAFLINTLMQRVKELPNEDELSRDKKTLVWKKIQRLLINIMERMPKENLDLADVHKFYKMASSPKVRERIHELLIGNYGAEAIPVFLDVFNDRRGITPEQIAGDKRGRTKTSRARRMDAIEGYACLVEKGNIHEFRKQLLSENDPLFVLRTIDELLLGKGKYQRLGQRAVVDVIDEDLRAGSPSLSLACLAWIIRHKDYEMDFESLLKKVFSLDVDLAQAFLNLNETWVLKVNEIQGERNITEDIEKPGTKALVSSLGLGRLIKWMSSDNEILRRNAIAVFNLVSNDYIKLFLSTRRFEKERELLKKLIGIEGYGGNLLEA